MAESLRHHWNIAPREAIARQRELALQIRLQPLPAHFEVLAAADLAYLNSSQQLVAVIVTYSWPHLQLLECVHVVEPVGFPYIPGLLSFREIPPLLAAHQLLRRSPDVFLCDGQGLAHPRKLGLACHLGLCLQIPTVGCAKKRLCGEHHPLKLQRGNHTALYLDGEMVGQVLCSRDRVKPLYISPGHLADFDSSRALVLHCLGRYRQPEPLRYAHNVATGLRRQMADSS
ncbi:MAG TPA: endonuclease V [Syntrophobacteraceae bacterium]|nr:endonuclease V [Syntrophobacteraceae bacterium]